MTIEEERQKIVEHCEARGTVMIACCITLN